MQAVQITFSPRRTVKMPKQYNHHKSLRKKTCLWEAGFLEGNKEEEAVSKFHLKMFKRIEKLLPDQSQCGITNNNFSKHKNAKC